jgi:hypothetical protein
MRLIVVNQDNGTGRIDAMFKVFKASALAVMPTAEIVEVKFPPLDPKNRALMINQAFVAAAKEAIKTQEPCAVCDVDLMFLRSIDDAFASDFDVAVTTRDKMKYNTGLWFYRPSGEEFVSDWIDNSIRIYEKVHGPRPDKDYITKNAEHGGIDQTALAATRAIWEHLYEKKIGVLELPCKEWNATQSEWEFVDSFTRVVHVKSQLRNACFNRNIAVPKGCSAIVKQWGEYVK